MEINKTFLAACRVVHIYLTMLGLLVTLFFAVTGFTLNHPAWFGAVTPRVAEDKGDVPPALLAPSDALRIVEHVRQAFGVRGAMTHFNDEAGEISVAFKAPGETWDVTIDKATGRATARSERSNSVALLNNLHRGRHSGPVWSWVIDLSAGLVVLAGATGFVLWLAMPRRRRLGIAFLVLGTAATLAAGWFFVPGPDAPPVPRPEAGQR